MLVVTAALALAASAQAQTMMMDAPEAVRPPAGAQPAMTWTGTGELTYECRAKPDAAGVHEWTFVGPNATLADAKTRAPMGKYYAGPTWEAADGSKITGRQVAVAPAAAGNIPFQLVKTDGGQGAFKDVGYIQRVATKGGAAPAESCGAANAGTRKTVPYSADYVFYKAG
jgi:hypothetical protein